MILWKPCSATFFQLRKLSFGKWKNGFCRENSFRKFQIGNAGTCWQSCAQFGILSNTPHKRYQSITFMGRNYLFLSIYIFIYSYPNYQVYFDTYNIYKVLSVFQMGAYWNAVKDTDRYFYNPQHNQNQLIHRFLSVFLLCCGMSTYSQSPAFSGLFSDKFIINISIQRFYIYEMLMVIISSYYNDFLILKQQWGYFYTTYLLLHPK